MRTQRTPLLLRLTVPRLSGHSGQDTQAYKSPQILSAERARDPLTRLHSFLVPALMGEEAWNEVAGQARREVETAIAAALARPHPDPAQLTRYVFSEPGELQEQGGLAPAGFRFAASSATAHPEGTRINMLTAIRRTLDSELAVNQRMVVFGEDVGPKGGVHGATLGLQEQLRQRARLRHQPVRGGHHRACRRHGARRPAAGGGDPVPQVRRSGRRAAQ